MSRVGKSLIDDTANELVKAISITHSEVLAADKLVKIRRCHRFEVLLVDIIA